MPSETIQEGELPPTSYRMNVHISVVFDQIKSSEITTFYTPPYNSGGVLWFRVCRP